MGNLQLVLYRGLRRGGGLQVFDISGQRVLHIFERVAQLTDLVIVFNRGQRGVELSLCHLIGGAGQQLQGLCRALDGEVADQEDD